MPIINKAKTLLWTTHAKGKMSFYKLSEQRIRRVLHSPYRIEEGIAPNTIAMMQPASIRTVANKQKWTQEIWVMIQETKTRRKIISAWRYPGMTKQGEPLPEEIIRELKTGLGKY
ncbi:hypothetical protein A2999_02740 [Candidatus Wolfebacteria bacterium RIFCSPLOWO2_01_FULL_38_11]|uniref:Uncharacterized protein n=2 Tax=Candidatus Wolfeibacteriota TaxID=1752735 RepID=A0A0G0FWC0_9BACT|nr:MAG: hypothetical protein US36_C0002G0033 [Candidatus Wolfebacteria bacterium GW2011_GWC1_37_10]OGM91379.1 MAG: hypothetical protein A2999_02740 [Candidatus Wolfebacteria bacterium RIFCSPLOWO2_01_FULL_38_11]